MGEIEERLDKVLSKVRAFEHKEYICMVLWPS